MAGEEKRRHFVCVRPYPIHQNGYLLTFHFSEPEFRLVLIIGVLVPSTIGFFLFGNLAGDGKSPASVSVAWGVAVVAPQFMSVAVGTYVVDAYRPLAQEIFIIAMVLKNFLFFGFSCELYVPVALLA